MIFFQNKRMEKISYLWSRLHYQ